VLYQPSSKSWWLGEQKDVAAGRHNDRVGAVGGSGRGTAEDAAGEVGAHGDARTAAPAALVTLPFMWIASGRMMSLPDVLLDVTSSWVAACWSYVKPPVLYQPLPYVLEASENIRV